MLRRHPGWVLLGAGILLPLLLAPVLANGTTSLALVLAAVAGSLAWISPALPAALDGIPGVAVALTGSDPLPAGGTVALLSAWSLLAVGLAVARRPALYPLALYLRPPLVLSAALATLMVLRLSVSAAPEYGSSKVQLFLLVDLVAIVVGTTIGRRARDLDLFVLVLLGVALLTAAALLRGIVTGSAQQVFTGRESLSAAFNPILLARGIAEGALLCVALLAGRDTSPALRTVSFALLPVFAVTLIATGSRGPLLALLAGLAVLLTLVLRDGRGLRYVAALVCALVLTVAVVPHVLATPASANRALSVFTGADNGLSSNGRDVLWAQAEGLIREHPLLGVGTGGFAAYQPLERYPHTIVLETGAELGVVGLLLLVGIVAAAVAYLARAWRFGGIDERRQVALVAGLLTMALVDANFSGDVTGNARVWLFAGLATGLAWRRS